MDFTNEAEIIKRRFLSDIKWGDKCKKKESKLFESREDAVAYCQQLLDKKELFHRARKIVQNKKGNY